MSERLYVKAQALSWTYDDIDWLIERGFDPGHVAVVGV